MVALAMMLLLVALMPWCLVSCDDTGGYKTDGVVLTFSTDTLTFDTVFVTMGTATRQVKVYNNYDEPLLLKSVTLKEGRASRFRINVDGDTSMVARNVEIAAHDSIFIFVHVVINPNAATEPFLVEDAIVFDWGTGSQQLVLTAFGRNAVYHLPTDVVFDNMGRAYPYSVIDCDSWDHQRPHIIYGFGLVYAGSTLSLQAGDEVYFADNGYLWVYDGATLKAQGSAENPVRFSSVRHDGYYDYLAGQWGYIWLSQGSRDNEIDWAVIENGYAGLVVDTNVNNNPTLRITNSRIENFALAGIVGQGAYIVADNLLVDNCGVSTLSLSLGGRYLMSNSTFADYWGYRGNNRATASVVLNNWYESMDGIEVCRDLQECWFRNCIIYGNYASSHISGEIKFDFKEGAQHNVRFDNCLILSPIAAEHAELNNTMTDSVPRFLDDRGRDYRLQSDSPALGAGDMAYVTIPHDLLDQPRLNPPAIGCYEWQDTTAVPDRKIVPMVEKAPRGGYKLLYQLPRGKVPVRVSAARLP